MNEDTLCAIRRKYNYIARYSEAETGGRVVCSHARGSDGSNRANPRIVSFYD